MNDFQSFNKKYLIFLLQENYTVRLICRTGVHQIFTITNTAIPNFMANWEYNKKYVKYCTKCQHMCALMRIILIASRVFKIITDVKYDVRSMRPSRICSKNN